MRNDVLDGVAAIGRSRSRRNVGWLWVCGLLLGSAVSWVSAPHALADTPAATDFGQRLAEPMLSDSDGTTHAMFVTLYSDGREQVEVRMARGDSVAAFAAEHPGWRLDNGMTWFMQMPVYVRELSETAAAYGHTAV